MPGNDRIMDRLRRYSSPEAECMPDGARLTELIRASHDAISRIEELEGALREIKALKSEPIGDTGFAVGPLSLFNAAQRIAKKALPGSRSTKDQGNG